MSRSSDVDLVAHIRALVAADKLELAIETLSRARGSLRPALADELLQHHASLARSRADGRRGLLDWAEEERVRTRVRLALLEILHELTSPMPIINAAGTGNTPGGAQQSPPGTKRLLTVFISYTHADSAAVERLRAALEAQGVVVRIDHDAMKAGGDIAHFIFRSVRDTDVTLYVVSRASLLSPWVALETVRTLYDEDGDERGKLIATYLDDSFLNVGFRLEATEEIDARIEEIDKLLARYIEQRLDTNDLNQEKSRLFELRNNLGTILQRLKNCLCLDIREPHFDQSLRRLVDALER